MKKWVTIGDYEGEAIVGDGVQGNDNANIKQRLETCEEENVPLVPSSCELDPLRNVPSDKLNKVINDSEASEKDGSEVSEKDCSETSEKCGSEVSEKDGSEVSEKDFSEASEKNCSEISEKDCSEASEKDCSEASEKYGSDVSEKGGSESFEKPERKYFLGKIIKTEKSHLEGTNWKGGVNESCHGGDKFNDKKATDKTEYNSNNINGGATDSDSKEPALILSKWKLIGSRNGKLKDSFPLLNRISNSGTGKAKTGGENCDGAMDAELPTPEHITSFYDLVRAVKNSNENLSAQEIENKFKQLSLAFKTDRLTLKQRLDVQHRQRDTAEANFERELDQLRKSILALHEECLDTDLVDAIMEVRKHVDVLTTSSSSLLSASEVWGAVQQEWRVSKALEVLLLHVENVNRLYEHDHQELEEMRRVLQENQIEYPASSGTATSHFSLAGDLEGSNRRGRTYSFHNITKQTSENGNRRISLGPGTSKAVLNQFLNQRASKRRLSLVPDLRSYHQELANAVEKAVAAKAQENNEEKSNNNMMRSSITEEGRESGEETDSAGQDNSNNSPTSATLRSLTQYPLYGQSLEDPSEMSYEDDSTSLINSQVTDTQTANNSPDSLGSQSHNWLLQYCEEIFHYCRTGNWPDTNQQIIRCVFTSFLLLVAVFCLIIAATSADEGLLEPRCPDWTMFIKYNGLPPT